MMYTLLTLFSLTASRTSLPSTERAPGLRRGVTFHVSATL